MVPPFLKQPPILPTPPLLWRKSEPPPPPFSKNFENSNLPDDSPDDGRSIFRNVAHLNRHVHDVINLLYYEYWTDKQKYFYVLVSNLPLYKGRSSNYDIFIMHVVSTKFNYSKTNAIMFTVIAKITQINAWGG